jgi:hypothetical protein
MDTQRVTIHPALAGPGWERQRWHADSAFGTEHTTLAPAELSPSVTAFVPT